MKRIAYFTALAVACVSGAGSAGAQTNTQPSTPATQTVIQPAPEDSLGNYARSVRKDKKQNVAKHFDNDNLPSNDNVSIVGSAGAPATTAANQSGPDDSASHTPTREEQQKTDDEWKDKLSKQKDAIDLLSRELDVAQREYKLREAAMYGDAGNRLRNSADWDKEDSQYKQQIADKQKALDDAKKQLQDMQEQARKSGVPTSERE